MMWELYERLIEPIPDDVPVDEIIVGTSCTMVRAGGAAGAAANQRLESRPRILEEEEWERGMTWRQAASLISSWNFLEAGIGAAAINAYYNRESVLMDGIAAYEGVKILESCDTFAAPGDAFSGKKWPLSAISIMRSTIWKRQENSLFWRGNRGRATIRIRPANTFCRTWITFT